MLFFSTGCVLFSTIWGFWSLLPGARQTNWQTAVSGPSEPAVPDQLHSAQYWLISPLIPGLQGPVTPTIVWLRPVLIRVAAPDKAPVIKSGSTSPSATTFTLLLLLLRSPLPAFAELKRGQTNMAQLHRPLTFPTTATIWKSQQCQEAPVQYRGRVSVHLLLSKHRCVRSIGEPQQANAECKMRGGGKAVRLESKGSCLFFPS